MLRKLIAAATLVVLVLASSLSPVSGGKNNCKPSWKCQPTTAPTLPPTAQPTTYTFRDEFDGTSLNPVWIRHFSCCGTLVGYDPANATVSNGVLSIKADRRSDGWWSYLLDTKTTFIQKYGYFEARIKVPKGKGLWPAFWHYYSGHPEIDTMEVCANPIGTNGGNDVSLLHQVIHYASSTGTNAQVGVNTRTVDLSLAYHVYGVDWRANSITFYLDGQQTGRFTNASQIPQIALPVILNLGIGGSWCSAPDTTTPSPSFMLVDWVRVRA